LTTGHICEIYTYIENNKCPMGTGEKMVLSVVMSVLVGMFTASIVTVG